MDVPVYIKDEINAVAGSVESALHDKNLLSSYHIQFMYGHPLEIVKRLQEQSGSTTGSSSKFPAIILFADFKIERGARLDMYGTTKLNLIIANDTQPQFYAEDRYRENFIPILYPIYTEFMIQLRNHKQFEFKSQDEIKHTLIERLFWGREGLYGNVGNEFNDFIDCIEIQNLEITIRKKRNC
jgi:hypothetical protein